MTAKRWTATYTITESPGYAEIGDIPADTEADALTSAEQEVGTDLVQWGYAFRLLELRGVHEQKEAQR